MKTAKPCEELYLMCTRARQVTYELKVVLLHLWRVNVKTIGGFICITLEGFTQFNSRHKTTMKITVINIGRHKFLYKHQLEVASAPDCFEPQP
jgi:hypothetical protein